MVPLRLLLVDDSRSFLYLASKFLEQFSEATVVGLAVGGAEGLQQAQSTRPDLVLADLSMPKMPGLELITRLREVLPQIGIIALTNLDNEAYRQAALKAGADDFVPKGAMHEELLPAIRRVARARGLLGPDQGPSGDSPEAGQGAGGSS